MARTWILACGLVTLVSASCGGRTPLEDGLEFGAQRARALGPDWAWVLVPPAVVGGTRAGARPAVVRG